MIYDEESDRHVHITFDQAIYATGYGSTDGPEADIFGVRRGEGGLDATIFNKCAAQEQNAIDALRASGAVGGIKADGTPVDPPASRQDADRARADFVTAMIAAVKNGRWVPIEIVIARPFIEHLMLSAIVAVAGRETGATLFGCADCL